MRRGTWISRPSSSSFTRNFRLPLARSYQLICIKSMTIQTDQKNSIRMINETLCRCDFGQAFFSPNSSSSSIRLHSSGWPHFLRSSSSTKASMKTSLPLPPSFWMTPVHFFRRNLKKSILAERYYFLCMVTQFFCQKLFCRFENSWKIDLIRGW